MKFGTGVFCFVMGASAGTVFLMYHFCLKRSDCERALALEFSSLLHSLLCYCIPRFVARSMVLLPMLSVTSLGCEQCDNNASGLIYVNQVSCLSSGLPVNLLFHRSSMIQRHYPLFFHVLAHLFLQNISFNVVSWEIYNKNTGSLTKHLAT